jgi:hypothetical protein
MKFGFEFDASRGRIAQIVLTDYFRIIIILFFRSRSTIGRRSLRATVELTQIYETKF